MAIQKVNASQLRIDSTLNVDSDGKLGVASSGGSGLSWHSSTATTLGALGQALDGTEQAIRFTSSSTIPLTATRANITASETTIINNSTVEFVYANSPATFWLSENMKINDIVYPTFCNLTGGGGLRSLSLVFEIGSAYCKATVSFASANASSTVFVGGSTTSIDLSSTTITDAAVLK
jgi:hypothetical protein